ncbi:MAG: TonB-dependent receptor, plug [Candidatus Solibacter sp.]|nr:TonB-dependent receptor, plug [Candidatus Solibacter sp.]
MMRPSQSLAQLCAPLLLAILAGPSLHAQATAGSLLGRVEDPSGAVVPAAAIEARHSQTGLVANTRSDSAGEYWLPALPPGSWQLTVSKAGFGTAIRSGIELAIDQKLRVDIKLTVDAVRHEETVTAQSQALQTQSAETGEVIESRQILDLPLLGRSFLDLARLTSGVVSGSGGNTLNLAVNGQREFANSVVIDGVEMTSNRNNDTSIRPSVDSVEEFKVLASAYTAEYGRASGAVVAVQMKSGANRPHGDLYEFFRPNVTAARSFFSTEPSQLKQHNFGGTLGGAVRKDKTFFFASYEGVRQRTAFSYLDSVPPSNQIRFTPAGADLSGLKDPLTGKQIPIFDPYFFAGNYYASSFPGNVIPASRVSPAGKAVLQNFFPAPSRAGALNGWFSNFNSRQAYSFDSDTVGGRVDHIFSEKDRLSAIYHYGSFGSLTGDRFAGAIPVAGGGDADYGDHENARNQALSLSEIHVFSPRWLNEARVGITRYRLDQLSLLDGRDLAAQFGAGNVNLPGYPQTSGFPDIYLGFGAQTGGSTYKPLHFLDRNLQLSDSVSGRIGRHELKAGAQFRQLKSAPFFSLFPTGFQYYGGAGVSLTGDPNYSFFDASAFYYNGGSDVADLLLGLPYSVNLGLQMTSPETRSWEGSFYAQDTWQVARSLVLSLGVRYEYFAPWTEKSNQMSNFDLATRQLLIAGRGANSNALITPDRNNFGPRVGLAWMAGPHTVLRTGWGVFYSPENDAREDVLTKNYPFAVQQLSFNSAYALPFAYTLDAGVPRIAPNVASTVASLTPAAIQAATHAQQNVFVVDSGMRTGYSQLFNFMLQRELPAAITVEGGYVGSVSRKLPYAIGNLNRSNSITAALGQMQAQFSEGSASYHSLQLKASHRFHRGLSFLTAYTFAKNLDNGPAPFNLGHNLNSHNQPQDPSRLNLERAAADNDVRHTFVGSGVYELPFGFQFNAIVTARSGLPVNVVRNPQDSGFEGLRPNLLRDPNLSGDQQTLAHYFDTAAFTNAGLTGANKHALGNAGRNLVRGPGLANLDASLFKEFLTEWKARLQLRFEFFNVTNTAHFANPTGDMSSGKFGSITGTIANPRIVQFAAKLKW